MRKVSILTGLCLVMLLGAEVFAAQNAPLWDLAKSRASVHRFSTLFTAHDMRDSLGSEKGLSEAVAWCKATGVTKVYLEVFRGNYTAERKTLERARERFRREGFVVQGCVTPTQAGKRSTGWNIISCYTAENTQEKIEEVFRFAASLFDVIMIDDFWFTDCECQECKTAKGERSWSEYRLALMHRVSRERVIGPAREVNPRVQIIIKYPEWYERFHERGYGVVRETRDFDMTWIGTETRDPDNERWGMKPQYGAYWLSQWAAAFSGEKLGGGWFDPLGTTPQTYLEQARQTILGQCPESMLFCYGALHKDHGPDDVKALRSEIPGLIDLAAFVKGERARGVGAYKPPNSDAGQDIYIFNFIGMLGLPLTADVEFPGSAPSLFLTRHALADPLLETKLKDAIEEKKPMLLTSNLLANLPAKIGDNLKSASGVQVLELKANAKAAKAFYGVSASIRALRSLPRERIDALRAPLLKPLGIELSAPTGVALYLYGEDKAVVENFNNKDADVLLSTRGAKRYEKAVILPQNAEIEIQTGKKGARFILPARSMLALRLR